MSTDGYEAEGRNNPTNEDLKDLNSVVMSMRRKQLPFIDETDLVVD